MPRRRPQGRTRCTSCRRPTSRFERTWRCRLRWWMGGEVGYCAAGDGKPLTPGQQTGQDGAIVMGLARALLKYDPALEAALRGSSALTRDSRMQERKKYGQ